MHRKLPIILTLVAWLLATGAHWDLVQTAAWAKMFASNARVMPIGAALARTFSADGRCELCVAVATAKDQQDDQTPAGAEKAAKKHLLVYQATPFLHGIFSEAETIRSGELHPRVPLLAAPPVPPPRSLG